MMRGLLVGLLLLGALAAPALGADPAAAKKLKDKGDASARAGNKELALEAYEMAIDADPGYLPSYDAAAPLWFARKDWTHAAQRLRGAVKVDAKYAMGWYNLAFALRKSGDLEGAVEAYKKFAALRPSEPDPYFGLGVTYKAMGKPAEARAAFKKYLELEKRADKGEFIERAKQELAALEEPAAPAATGTPREQAAAAKQDGDARRDAGDAPGAEQAYRKAIELDPSWGAPHNELGTLLFGQSKLDDAIAEFERAVALEPKNEVAWYNLAHARRKAGRHEPAVAAYQKYIELQPGNPDPYYGLGQSLLALGKRAEARAAFATYVKLETRPSEKKWVDKAKQEIAAIDAKDGQVAPAAPPAAEPAPPKAGPAGDAAGAKAFITQGDAAFAAKKYGEAIGHYRGAVAADPASLDARYKLGVALAASGDLSGAITAWEGVLLLSPQHEKARRNIELARKRLGKTERQPVDEVAVLQRARALVDDGRHATALAMLDALLADPLHAQNLEALSLRAEARLGSGDPSGAAVDWLTVLALDPRFARAYRGLARAYAALGDQPRADYYASLGTQLAP